MLYGEKGDYASAEKHLRKAIEISEKLDFQLELAIDYRALGVVYKRQKDKVRAEQFLKLAKKMFRELGEKERLEEVIKELEELEKGSSI